jgi:hypothetical protein
MDSCKDDGLDPGLARRSIAGLKQLFKLHGTSQAATSNSASLSASSQSPDCASNVTSQPDSPSITAPRYSLRESHSPSTNQAPISLESPARKYRISRIFSVFSRSKRDFGVALSETADATQDDLDSESQYSEVNDEVYDKDDYSDNGEPGEHEHDHRIFSAIRAISRKSLEDFVLQLVCPSLELNFRICRVTRRKEGSFHHAVFLQTELGGQLQQEFVLKIPAHRTP